MASGFKRFWSIKTKTTLLTSVIFLVSIWSLAFYANRALYRDMTGHMGAEQFTTAEIVASQINQELIDRIDALQAIAARIDPARMGDPASLQTILEGQPLLGSLFNGGVTVVKQDGTAIADYPRSNGRIGVNYLRVDYVAANLKEGTARIGKPIMGPTLKAPVFGMGVPIKDAKGNTIGALSGVTNLSKPNFLDKITQNRYGRTGGYLLVAPQYRLVVTATDKSRIMQPLPAAGINSYIDRNIAGYEGWTVLIDPLGLEQLASMKKIPKAGWFLAVVLPANEAFAPIHRLQQRIMLAAVALTLLAGGLIWLMMKRQLSPMFAAIESLARNSSSELLLSPMPVVDQDEIGQLIGSFNVLLERIQRLTNLYGALNECSQAIMRCKSKEELYLQICTDTVRVGGMGMAWIGLADPETHSVRVAASFGAGADLLREPLVASDFGHGPADAAIREERPIWRQDFQDDPAAAAGGPSERFGWASSASLPIFTNGRAIGALTLYSMETNAFDLAERNLLVELSTDISYALDNFVREDERKRAEENLRQKEADLRRAQQIAKVGSWTMDLSSGKILWSDELYKIYGVSGEAFTPNRHSFLELVHPCDRFEVQAGIDSCIAEGKPRETEYRVIRPDGTVRNIKGQAEMVLDAEGHPEQLAGTAMDITASKQAEEILRLARFSIEHSSDGIFWITPDARIVDANEAACRSLGYSRDEMLRLTIPDIDPCCDYDAFRRSFANLRQHGTRTFEAVHATKDGARFPVEIVSSYLSFGDEERNCAFVRNIAERKQAEEEKRTLEQQFQQTQRLESLGVLSGGIAHDFNNILAIIMGYCSLTKMEYETAQGNIEEIEKAAERGAELCRQMLAYAGKAQLTKTRVDIGSVVDEMATMLKSTLPRNSVIKTDLPTGIPAINADASQIRQVVMNMIINASEAIGEEQGEIGVSLARTAVTADQAAKDYHGEAIPPGEYVCLEVADNGCGMNEETKWRIFEPFYTTKFSGRGLGMSAVLGIIQSHGGALQLFSRPGQGTTFKVYLPVRDSGSLGDEGRMHAPSPPWQGSGTILLVEDEDQIRFIASSLLANFGFEVLEAANGKEALEAYRKNAADIIPVLTDMGMPVMDGYALFPALKQLDHNLPIIVSSGFGFAEVASRIGRDDIAGIIDKPYNPDQLREVVKRVVAGMPDRGGRA